MALSKEELLKPRYKVIARWPDMARDKFFEGQIIQLIQLAGEQACTRIGNSTLYDAWFDGFPHLFKKLEWWEERAESDMPGYISLNPENTTGGPEVFKVLAAKKDESGRLGINHTFPVDENNPFDDFVDVKYFLPATEEEYNAYNSQKQTP